MQLRDTANGTIVAVSVKSAGFIDVAMLDDVHGLSAMSLVQANTILV